MGAGPAGLTIGNILRAAAIDCVVLETESREFIEQRPRAGFIEEWAVRALQRRGLADRCWSGPVRTRECEFRFAADATGSGTPSCRATATSSIPSRCW